MNPRIRPATVLLPGLLLAAVINGCGPSGSATLSDPSPNPNPPATTHAPAPLSPSPSPTPSPTVAPTDAAWLQLPTATCHIRWGGGAYLDGWLPDPHCTPGVTNPDVTQATLTSTICKSGWTATIRPVESYTAKLKIQGVDQTYAYRNQSLSAYQEDHLIPLELGGSPTDPRNLWPEPGGTHDSKDGLENQLKAEVCSGYMPLALAQQAIVTNWTTLPPPNASK